MPSTRLTKLVGVDHPLVCGGMHHVRCAELVNRIVDGAEAIMDERFAGMRVAG